MTLKWLGGMIQERREAKGWNQKELARRVKVTDAYIAMLETGKRKNPSRAVLKRLARALDVSVTELRRKGGSNVSSNEVVFDSRLNFEPERVTPELLVWTILRLSEEGWTPHELASRMKEEGFVKGEVEAITAKVKDMLVKMSGWSGHRRIKEVRERRFRAYLESD